MSDLAAFLRARLDEDEQRALREVEAKRAILAAWLKAEGLEPDDWPEDQGYRAGLRDALETLAAIYRDHPDYDPAWAQE